MSIESADATTQNMTTLIHVSVFQTSFPPNPQPWFPVTDGLKHAIVSNRSWNPNKNNSDESYVKEYINKVKIAESWAAPWCCKT